MAYLRENLIVIIEGMNCDAENAETSAFAERIKFRLDQLQCPTRLSEQRINGLMAMSLDSLARLEADLRTCKTSHTAILKIVLAIASAVELQRKAEGGKVEAKAADASDCPC